MTGALLMLEINNNINSQVLRNMALVNCLFCFFIKKVIYIPF